MMTKAYTELKHGTVIEVNGRRYAAGSIQGFVYSRKLYANPPSDTELDAKVTEAARAAITLGHELYWLNLECTVISNPPQSLGPATPVRVGEVVTFEGKFFQVEKTYPNSREHLKLTEVSEPVELQVTVVKDAAHLG